MEEGVFGLFDGVDADEAIAQRGAGEGLAMFVLDAADGGDEAGVGADVEILGGEFGGDAGGELAERFAVFDEDV